MRKLPKCIFFDWNKTLSFSLFWSQLSSSTHPLHSLHSQIIKYLFIDNKHLINPWMRGEYSSEDISRLIGSALEADSKQIFSELKRSCENMEFSDPLLPSLISRIRAKGIKAVIATDNMDTFVRFTMPAMNLKSMFDDFLVSSELKCLKGDFSGKNIKFFEKFLYHNKLKHSDTILLDDCIDTTGIYDENGLKIVEINSASKLVEVLSEYAA